MPGVACPVFVLWPFKKQVLFFPDEWKRANTQALVFFISQVTRGTSFPPLARLFFGCMMSTELFFLSDAWRSLGAANPHERLYMAEKVTHKQGWKCTPCVLSEDPLPILAHPECPGSQCFEGLSFYFLPTAQPWMTTSFTLTVCSSKHSKGNALREVTFQFPPESKYLGSWENGLPWSAQNLMEWFGLNLVPHAL